MSTKNEATNPLVEILMATYNGSKYLAEQIESIRIQTYQNWKLVIGDDGSSDSTIEIIERYCRLDSRISTVPERLNSQGAAQNFFNLLQQSNADYVMFSDQDDVWLPDKIECEIKAIKRLEKLHSNHTPLLVFTDSVIVDKKLSIINPSCSSLKPYDSSNIMLQQLLIDNVGQGCTMLLNRPLCNLICRYQMPPEFKMHDYWVMSLALLFGHIAYLSCPTVLYRQHDNNVFGMEDRAQTAKTGLKHLVCNPAIIKGWLTRLATSEKEFQKRAKSLLEIAITENASLEKQRTLQMLEHFEKESLLNRLRIISGQKLLKNQRSIYAKFCQCLGLAL